MPKIAVYEYHDLSLSKNDIGFPGQSGGMFPKAVPATVKFSANGSFETCVSAFYTGHTEAALARSQIVSH